MAVKKQYQVVLASLSENEYLNYSPSFPSSAGFATAGIPADCPIAVTVSDRAPGRRSYRSGVEVAAIIAVRQDLRLPDTGRGVRPARVRADSRSVLS